MKDELKVKLRSYASLFDKWADAIFLNADEEFIQDTYAENKLYRIISASFQEHSSLDLDKIRNSEIYNKFKINVDTWNDLYSKRFGQNPKATEILKEIGMLADDIISEISVEPDFLHFYKNTISDLIKTDKTIKNTKNVSESELEALLSFSFNLIEKSYVEKAYVTIEDQITDNGFNVVDFWEEPVMEYIMETWWPKRRVYTNRVLMIGLQDFPNKINFNWTQFMSDRFYKCGIFNFLKQLRNQLTHVKTSGYHNEQMGELFTRESMTYWCQMNNAIVLYIMTYLMV